VTACQNDKHEGGCFCGAVRYRVDGSIESVAHCHCNSCRRSAGAAFVTWFTVERDRLAWTKGGVTQYLSIDITVGSLDCAAGHPAHKHIWTADKLEWLHLDDRLPAHAGWSTGD
jgi:hypothetical protein